MIDQTMGNAVPPTSTVNSSGVAATSGSDAVRIIVIRDSTTQIVAQATYFNSNFDYTYPSLAVNAQGPNSTITTACVAGTQAVGEGFRMVSQGDADVILAGGADSRIDPLLLLAYLAMGALSRAQRPATEVSHCLAHFPQPVIGAGVYTAFGIGPVRPALAGILAR